MESDTGCLNQTTSFVVHESEFSSLYFGPLINLISLCCYMTYFF